jgi:uncharacterized repeat protein (TIGR03803 family)
MRETMNHLSRLALGAAFLGFTGAAMAAPTETVLYSFKGSQHRDGSSPQSDLIADANGNLYGTTQTGGKRGGTGAGTVFELTPTGDPDVWTETVLYDFKDGSDGSAPIGGLLMDAKGVLYGTTENGGAMNDGTVFKLSPPKTAGGTWHESVLYSFCAQTNCADGAHPIAGLTVGKKGVLYGTTQFGGAGAFEPQEGTAFQLTPPATKGGAWTETVLHSFCSLNDCADGFEPNAGRLLRSFSGVLYGMTTKSDSAGVVYALTPSGGGYVQTILHDFSLSGGDGRGPLGGLVADKAGNLYGTTQSDSGNGCGTVFQLSQAGDLSGYTILYSFCQNADHSDGAIPDAGVILTLGKHGLPSAIYGTTLTGDESTNGGVVFKLTPGSTGPYPWTDTVLYSFCSQTDCTDGANPRFGPLLDLNGAFYGTTQAGGATTGGTVYRVTE